MQLYVPPLGTTLKLSKEWTFKLYHESRNAGLFEYFGIKLEYWPRDDRFNEVTLTPGTTLKIDRIYIRKGQSGFDSITFFMRDPSVKKAIRFWAKLEDANRIEFDHVD